MGETRTLNIVIGWVLAIATIAFVAVLFGVGSDALTNDPPPDSPYAADRTTTTAVGAPGAGRLVVSEVGFTDEGWVRITNVGGAATGTGGHWLCNRPAYFELPDTMLGPGESMIVASQSTNGALDGLAAGGQVAEAGGSIGSIADTTGEMGLYTSSNFSDSASLISYVEWGQPNHGRSVTAVEAGVWVDGGFVASSGASSLTATVDVPGSPDDWTAGG